MAAKKVGLTPARRAVPELIGRILAGMREVDAVFLLRDGGGVLHVYSVVREFQPEIYGRLLKKERLIEGKLSQIAFEFHVRAHQGREPEEAVPVQAKMVYRRS